MNDLTAPTNAELEQLAALATRPENRQYFFEHLKNPMWVSALAERGYFSDPPDPAPADEPGYVHFPPWPEGRYLLRMAPLAPSAIAKVLKTVPPSGNPRVTNLLLECAQALPSRQFKELAPTTVDWITNRESSMLLDMSADAAASTIRRLLREGKTRQGLKATEALLRLERRFAPSAYDDPALRIPPEPVGRLSDWEYKQAIETMLPDLVDSAGIKTLKLFSRLLRVAVKFSKHPEDPPDSDEHSYIWRPAIEEHPQNRDSGVRSALVAAVRDAAVRLARGSEDDLQSVVTLLEGETLLHRRIALSVLSVVVEGSELAAERIANREIFDDYRLKHEYCELLRSRLGEIPQDAKRTFLDWVGEGPDLAGYRRGCEDRTGSEPSGEDETEYSNVWKRDWFSVVSEHLSGSEAEHYDELVADYGDAGHPDFLSWSVTSWGPVTPLTAQDMASMSELDVIEYLATWEPKDRTAWDFGPTPEGLGRAFKEVVTNRAVEFAVVASHMKPLDRTYIRHFFDGLEAAVKEGISVPWDQPVLLMASVVEHPLEAEDNSQNLDRDASWSSTYGQIATLLQAGFGDRDNKIPFESRETVWDVLESLSRDPNPTPADEEIYGYSPIDPDTMSINTTRGKTMHAVVAYALWCLRELKSRSVDTAAGLDLMPEVRVVLEEHLDPSCDPSLAVRSVYGRWLPWLVLLDERWVSANITRILPPHLDLLRSVMPRGPHTSTGARPTTTSCLCYETRTKRLSKECQLRLSMDSVTDLRMPNWENIL